MPSKMANDLLKCYFSRKYEVKRVEGWQKIRAPKVYMMEGKKVELTENVITNSIQKRRHRINLKRILANRLFFFFLYTFAYKKIFFYGEG